MENVSSPLDCTIEWTVFQAEASEFPSEEENFDGYIITGSRNGVYEEFPWCACVLTSHKPGLATDALQPPAKLTANIHRQDLRVVLMDTFNAQEAEKDTR
eukprot:9499688-Pyramimonas_sp.AAC.1